MAFSFLVLIPNPAHDLHLAVRRQEKTAGSKSGAKAGETENNGRVDRTPLTAQSRSSRLTSDLYETIGGLPPA